MSRQTRNLLLAMLLIVAVAVAGLWIAGSAAAPPLASVAAAAPLASGIISPAQYTSQYAAADAPHLLLDVRTPEEFAGGHLPGAVNIPLDSLSARLSEVPADQPVVVYCRSGNRSATAATLLSRAGYAQVLDLGGIIAWQAAGYEVVR